VTSRGLIAIGLAILFACSCGKRTQNLPPVATKSKWQSVSLPSRPVYLTSNDDAFWVSGTDEMLAKSEDGGQSWRVTHRSIAGNVLMEVHFPGKTLGYAAGTGGLILWTQDGGETWKPRNAGSDANLAISFADERHGIRHTKSGLDFTNDGGLTWIAVPPLPDPDDREKFKIVTSLAALDSKHSAVLLKNDPHGDDILVTTNDGGETWDAQRTPHTARESVVIHEREYWAFGFEVLEHDKPGGGYSVPLVLHSADGTNWIHGTRIEYEHPSCNDQGCILWDGAIVNLYGKKPVFTKVPTEGVLSPMWATAKGTVCTLNLTLKCAKSWAVESPLPRIPPTHGSMHGSADNLPAGCLVCPVDSLFISKESLGGETFKGYSKYLDDGTPDESSAVRHPGVQSSVGVDFVVQQDGTVGSVHVKRAPTEEIGSAVSKYIGNWIFDPPRENGAPEEARHNLLLGLWCSASPTEQEASCLLQVVESDWKFVTAAN
jgi:photosystem II stability/assembly factor-like uncharacterized protein